METETAKNALISFFRKMNSWETEGRALVQEQGIENVRDELREKLTTIYDEFLIKSGSKYGRLGGPHIGYPPEYDEMREEITGMDQSNPAKVVIATLWRHPAVSDFTRNQKYTLSARNGKWRIAKKEIFRPATGQWENLVF